MLCRERRWPKAGRRENNRLGEQHRRDDRRDDRNDHRNDWRDDRNDRNDRNDHHNDWQDRQNEANRRQTTKNNWRNLATGAGGVALFGLLRKDPTITFAGTAGALYSLNRYEQDRKSQSQASQARANLFSQPYFYRDGARYERRLVNQNGQRYYRFERH